MKFQVDGRRENHCGDLAGSLQRSEVRHFDTDMKWTPDLTSPLTGWPILEKFYPPSSTGRPKGSPASTTKRRQVKAILCNFELPNLGALLKILDELGMVHVPEHGLLVRRANLALFYLHLCLVNVTNTDGFLGPKGYPEMGGCHSMRSFGVYAFVNRLNFIALPFPSSTLEEMKVCKGMEDYPDGGEEGEEEWGGQGGESAPTEGTSATGYSSQNPGGGTTAQEELTSGTTLATTAGTTTGVATSAETSSQESGTGNAPQEVGTTAANGATTSQEAGAGTTAQEELAPATSSPTTTTGQTGTTEPSSTATTTFRRRRKRGAAESETTDDVGALRQKIQGCIDASDQGGLMNKFIL